MFTLKQLFDILEMEYKFIPVSKSKKTLNYYHQWWKQVYGLIKNVFAFFSENKKKVISGGNPLYELK